MSLFHLEMDDSSLVGRFPGNFGGGAPANMLAYTFSFELPRHGMYTMDDLFPGEMLVLVYDHDLLKICLTILLFPDIGLFLEVGRYIQFPTENNEQTPDHDDDMIQLELRILPCHLLFIIFPNCFHDCIKTGLCIFIVFIHRM